VPGGASGGLLSRPATVRDARLVGRPLLPELGPQLILAISGAHTAVGEMLFKRAA
jgi:hypothetical protein